MLPAFRATHLPPVPRQTLVDRIHADLEPWRDTEWASSTAFTRLHTWLDAGAPVDPSPDLHTTLIVFTDVGASLVGRDHGWSTLPTLVTWAGAEFYMHDGEVSFEHGNRAVRKAIPRGRACAQALHSEEDSVWEAARDRALAFDDLPPAARVFLALAFPDVPALADAALRAVHAVDPPFAQAAEDALMPLVSDPESVRPLLNARQQPDWPRPRTGHVDVDILEAWAHRFGDACLSFVVDAPPKAQQRAWPICADFPHPHTAAIALRHRTRRACATWLRAHPELALRALVADPTLEDRPLQAQLAAAAPEVAAELFGDTSAPAVDTMPDSELPPVLRQPPWRARRKKLPALPQVELTVPDTPAHIAWHPGQRETWQVSVPPTNTWVVDAEEPYAAGLAGLGPNPVDDEHIVETWNNATRVRRMQEHPDVYIRVLARTGLAGLPGFLAAADRDAVGVFDTLTLIASPRIARLMAEALDRSEHRHAAVAWLLRHPLQAALGLIPDALGSVDWCRDAALSALRYLADHDALRQAAEHHGVTEILAPLIDADPLQHLPKRRPKCPAWFTPTVVGPLHARDGRALSDEALAAVTELLLILGQEPTYAGGAALEALCDPESLRATAIRLLEQWVASGARPKDGALLQALAVLGDATIIEWLTARIAQWPTERAHKRAVVAIDVLARIDSEPALFALEEIRATASGTVREAALAGLQRAAWNRGLTLEQLADRLVPGFGLNRSARRRVSYGERWFEVGLDERLRPRVWSAEGAALSRLPAPRADDDPEQAEAAQAVWHRLHTAAPPVLQRQLDRLEQAMCTRRTWSASIFRSSYAEHPLLRGAVRGLIWCCEGVCFRVAEDGSWADVDDEPFEGTADVSLPHPLNIPDLQRWGEVLADYALLQPIDQLTRPVFHLADADPTAIQVPEVAGRTVPWTAAMALARGSWSPNGYELLERTFGATQAVLWLRPGVVWNEPRSSTEQTIEQCALSRPLGEMHPIDYSELRRDLAQLIP